MKRIRRTEANRTLFDPRVSPAFSVKPGESFVIETEDALSGRLRDESTLPIPENLFSPGTTPPLSNPMGGPIYLEGAGKGDLVAVNIERIEVDAQGVTAIFPGAGPLCDSIRWQALSRPFTKIIRHLPGPSGTTRDGTAILREGVSWPLAPFIGCMGVCPEVEIETSSMGQGPWGGNLDVRAFREGSRVFLNAYHPGGLFYAGDVHAGQGDTEFTGTADETRAELQLSLEIVKNRRCAFVRIERPDVLISVAAARPLEDAVRSAIVDLMDWIVSDYGIDPREAYMHASVNPDFRVRIYQMAPLGRLRYTAGAEIPKRHVAKKS